MKENKVITKLTNVKKPSNKLIKRLIAAAVALVLLAGAGVFAAEKLESAQEQKANQAKQAMVYNQAKEQGLSLITEEEAKQVALQTAGVEESQAKQLQVKLEEEDDLLNQFIYEVEFDHNGLEYEILIDGVEKTVLQSEVE